MSERLTPNGVLLVDKPQGITSFDVVRKLRRIFKIKKIGHTGTLDPMATGLMLVCLGQATRLSPYLTDFGKSYRATVILGVETDSLDADGQVTHRADSAAVAQVKPVDFEGALEGFRGEIQQRPPAFSAIKVDGERLYAKARRGEQVEVPIRTVNIESLDLIGAEPPEFTFETSCSKGTYIRSLAADIGRELGVGGHLNALRRLTVGQFDVEQATTIAELEELGGNAACERLISMRDALGHLPAIELDPTQTQNLRQGRREVFLNAPKGLCIAVDREGTLVALVEANGDQPAPIVRGFPPP